MTVEEIYEMVEAIGLPCTYYSFPEKEAPSLPYVVFYFPNSNNFPADDRVYAHITSLNIELYTNEKSFEYEAAVESVLDLHGMVWEKSESYLNSEQMYEVLYEMEIIVNGE